MNGDSQQGLIAMEKPFRFLAWIIGGVVIGTVAVIYTLLDINGRIAKAVNIANSNKACIEQLVALNNAFINFEQGQTNTLRFTYIIIDWDIQRKGLQISNEELTYLKTKVLEFERELKNSYANSSSYSDVTQEEISRKLDGQRLLERKSRWEQSAIIPVAEVREAILKSGDPSKWVYGLGSLADAAIARYRKISAHSREVATKCAMHLKEGI